MVRLFFWHRSLRCYHPLARKFQLDSQHAPVEGVRRPTKDSVHFSSRTYLWETPQWFFDVLNREFNFDLDVCAIPANAKCARFYTPEVDGLRQAWRGVCWMNPPYGREIGLWMRKAYESSLEGATVVCLVPARTDTAWWHEFAVKASEIRFLRGRLKFGGSQNSAPFPSAVVIFGPSGRANNTIQFNRPARR
jgi:phage N-6-adenine-methyltransferase